MQPFELPDFYVPWPARQNPKLEIARAHAKTWAQEVGILGTPQDKNSTPIWNEQTFDRHDYALFCAYIHPEAPEPELNLMTDWNVWAFYVDDYFLQVYKQPKDRAGAKEYLDRVLPFMPAEIKPLPAPTNPMERGLADLWLRTAPAKSEAWRRRIIESMRRLLEAFLWELDSMSQQRLANPIEYIEIRRQVGAALWSADLVEHAMFVEIPERIAATRPIQVLKNTFADAVHLRNDLFSYPREVLKEGELTNAVLVIERFLEIKTQHAANLVNDLLTSRLQQFEHTVLTELAPLFQEYGLDPLEQAQMLTYIRGLQDWQSGAHEWHIQTSRYLNPRAGQTSSPGSFIPNFGTSAMRITPDALGLNRFKNYKHVPYKKVGPTRLPKFYMPFAAQINPHLETARRHSKAWARRQGMLDRLPSHPAVFIRDEHSFEATDVAFFSALAQPTATASQLNQYACWMVWGTYADDYFAAVYGHTRDLVGAKIFQTRLAAFMPLDLTMAAAVPLTPVERGLADLWATVAETLTIEQRGLFRKLIDELIGSWLWELSNRIQNRVPDPIDYVEMRHKTSAADLMLVFIRLAHAQDVPSEIYRTLTLHELNHVAMDYAGLNNDIVSYQKEIEFEGDLNNSVLVIENFLSCDRTQAVEIVNNLTTARIKQFEHIVATELPVLFENFNLDTRARRQVLGYVEELQTFIYASFQWHITSGCYKEFELQRSAKAFSGSLTGLGTSAARILTANGRGDVTAPAISVLSQADQTTRETPKETKIFAISHLAPPFAKKKEEAQAD